jgi:hypothetical protein
MDGYTFPFHTCEKVSSGLIAQPWSFGINMVSACILVGLALSSPSWAVRLVLGSYAAFEGWHAFSHAVHLEGPVLFRVVHGLGIGMAVSTLVAILVLSGQRLEGWQLGLIVGVFAVDIGLFLGMDKTLVSVGSGLTVLAVIVMVCYAMLPSYFKAALPWLVIGILGIFGLFLVEARYGKELIKREGVPFHAVIESLGLVLFSWLGVLFWRWGGD